jgi:Mg/Co/Ni transporter MgtE
MITLTSEIVSSDIFKIFWQDIVTGIIIGLILGLLVRATWWLWK